MYLTKLGFGQRRQVPTQGRSVHPISHLFDGPKASGSSWSSSHPADCPADISAPAVTKRLGRSWQDHDPLRDARHCRRRYLSHTALSASAARKSPDGVRQEFWAHLAVHYATMCVQVEAAHQAQLDPDRISRKNTVRVIRSRVWKPESFPLTPSDDYYRVLLAEVTSEINPQRRDRSYPRVVKRKMSNFPLKRAQHRQQRQASRPPHLTTAADLVRGILALPRPTTSVPVAAHADVLQEPATAEPPSNRPVSKAIPMGFPWTSSGTARAPHRRRTVFKLRLAALVEAALTDLGIERTQTDHQGTGDGEIVFLPTTTDVQSALPSLLGSFVRHLALDNATHPDRLRLRLAFDVGPAGLAAIGFSGETVVRLSRLLDSEPLRAAIATGDEDLAVMVPDHLTPCRRQDLPGPRMALVPSCRASPRWIRSWLRGSRVDISRTPLFARHHANGMISATAGKVRRVGEAGRAW